MALWSNLGKMANGATTKAVEQAKVLAEVTKLNSQVSDEEKRVTENYTKIGKLYFELHGEDCEEAFLEMITLVKESHSKIQALKQKIQDVKGIVRCSNCGAEIPKNSLFCNSCGAHVERPKPETSNSQEATAYCSACGSEVADDALFCGICGNRIHPTETVEDIVIPPKSEEIHPVAVEVPLAAPASSFTEPDEGSPIGDDVTGGVTDSDIQPSFSANSAQEQPDSIENKPKLESSSPSVIAERATPSAPVRRFCMNCGSAVENGNAFCAECGTPIE